MIKVRRTVRMRLTVLYSVLFVISSVVLLGITNGVGSTSVSSAAVATRPDPVNPPVGSGDVRMSVSHGYLLGSLIALGVMAVVSVVVGWLAAGRALRPLRAMTAATRRISADSLHERLAMQGPKDELKDLSDTIDALLERLDGAFGAQRRFVANASHELRTPLATVRALVDVAAAKPGPVPVETITLADRVRVELDRVDELLDGLLALARGQHGALPDRAVIALDQAVSSRLAPRADQLADRGLQLHRVHSLEETWIVASQPLLSRMIDNLLDNAILHNRDGGWIRVATAVSGSTARLVVENGGDVLAQEEVAELGRPFRRLGVERTGSDTAGAGLGLSIVAAIAEAHDGSLDLRARADGGLRVTVALPRAAVSGAADAALPGVPA
ncbi:sensor histidine kinase [Pseudofrankia inefficax]|uniref:histidine kinase n=1 Tax=Pseudofrankia inefficax (strain DSM 45817 / CECT 9037 / DDB 130130 / EuI1c) TaxID=298654 RepID=E3IZN7_PSEI1|nr:HAMP domain-containing sensor histidine kinase [Pseudofrankia inefficax]ADP83955.1 integral membrane sensor signal transduction histidine kinase [Pseudofrankia inefficax]